MNTQTDKFDATVKNVFSKYKKLNTKPSKCPDDELLVAYLKDNLSQNDIEHIEEHLLVCKKCTENLLCFSQAESSYCPTRKTLVTNKMVNRAKALVKPKITLYISEIISSRFSMFIRHAPVMVYTACYLAAIIFSIHYLETPFSAKLDILVKKPLMSTNAYNMPLTAGSDILAKDYNELEIENGEVLNSGDQYRINFKLTKKAYIYLIYLDSNGNLNLVFQEDALNIKPDKNYSFPKTCWLQVNKNSGHETFYLIASQEVIEDIDMKIEELEESGIEKIKDIFLKTQIQSFYFTSE
ncbi:MAG: DUF4384 domain-containing protein [Deltaproteobacteria bacterium]|nr:DUF4384 domain-containing protein [Deltaproteobacteria bacterium]